MSDIHAGAAAIEGPTQVGLGRRIISFPLVLMVLAIMLYIAGSALAGGLVKLIPEADGTPLMVVEALVFVACVSVFYWLFCRYVERAPVRDFERAGWARELLGGILGGALLFSAVVAVVAMLGGYSFGGSGEWTSLWPLLTLAILSGFGEELLFRGILFRFIEQMAGSWAALAVTSCLFGGAHLANPGATLFSSLAIALEAGIMLGAVYMLTRRLWAAIGVHAAWNFTQGWIFGLPVSGFEKGGIVEGRLSGPEMLTGGAFGLEASLVAVVIATAAGLTLLYLAVRRGRVVAPMWVRARNIGQAELHTTA